MPDGSETSSHTHAVEADVKKIRQLRVHDRARFFFRSALSILTTRMECLQENTHYIFMLRTTSNETINQEVIISIIIIIEELPYISTVAGLTIISTASNISDSS